VINQREQRVKKSPKFSRLLYGIFKNCFLHVERITISFVLRDIMSEHTESHCCSQHLGCSREHLLTALTLIDEEYARFPSGEELASKLKSKFTDTFENPPVAEIEDLLGRRESEDMVREALFNPTTDEHVEVYSALLVSGRRSQHKFLSLILAFLFLIHRKKWIFMSKFILNDGLASVAALLDEENLYIRGQAVEVLLAATDCDQFDWFVAPTNKVECHLHKKMLNLYKEANFLQLILKNRSHSYPGGSMRCLQILAFWLSWARAEYSENQMLFLSAGIIYELQRWSSLEQTPDAIEEEIELASTLVNDFGRERAAQSTASTEEMVFVEGIDEGKCARLITAYANEVQADLESTEVNFAEHVRALTIEVVSVMDLKERANEAYKNGDFTVALQIYDDALERHKGNSVLYHEYEAIVVYYLPFICLCLMCFRVRGGF